MAELGSGHTGALRSQKSRIRKEALVHFSWQKPLFSTSIATNSRCFIAMSVYLVEEWIDVQKHDLPVL